MNTAQSAIDIAVPVYNGYDDLVKCVESLKRHTDLTKHRVILIDDCSPDERIRPYLEEVCDAAGSRDLPCGMVAVFNEQNRGFSANVNIALSWSERDTILLNSDTVVTCGWVEKLQKCAYLSQRTATVTPLSNAATLASVPVFLKDNPVPEGYTTDSYAALVERVSLHRYPRITVAVGFCMYVRQDAYEAVGAFDERTFGRGYGEENDFCFRCSMLGYIHVLCDDTFIYHRGTASFDSEEKRALTQEHERILRRRYPEMMKANDAYCRDDPDREIRDNLLLWQCLDNGRKNLLYFLHLDFREIARSSIGGTQLHVRDLVRGMKGEYNVFVAARDGDALRLTAYVEGADLPEWEVLRREESADDGSRLISLKFPIGEEEPFPVFYDEALADVLEKILRAFRIDLVHVHHTQGLSLDIFRVCKEKGIPVIATLHDYYYACPTTKLVRENGRFCPAEGTFAVAKDRVCAACLHKSCGYGRVHVMKRWREECLSALGSCSRIIFPGKSAQSVMLSAYPSLADESMVIGHGTDAAPSGSELQEAPAHPVRTDRMHTHLDQKPGEEGCFHYISGWAYLEGADSMESTILIEITGSDGRKRCMKVRRNARADVAAAAADPLYLWSGIHAVFHVPDMPDGKYRLRILIRSGGKVYTDGKVYSGKYRGRQHAQEGRLRVAFLGGVTPAKGSGLLADVISSGDTRFSFYVYGEVGDPSVKAPEGADNVFFSGVYRKDDIFDLLKISGIDVACILPVWGETFCYTLSEAWSCGIPVIGTDIGAVGERIRETQAGWLVSPDAEEKDILELLGRILENPAELAEKKAAASALRLRSLEEMYADYRGLYALLCGGRAKAPARDVRGEDRDFILQGLAAGNACVTGRSGAAAMNRLAEENAMLRSSIEMMKNTTSYRFARKIADADIPFREQLKKLLKGRIR